MGRALAVVLGAALVASGCSEESPRPWTPDLWRPSDLRVNDAAPPELCSLREQSSVLGDHALLWRYISAGPSQLNIYRDLTRGVTVPLDLSAELVARWEAFTEEGSTAISESGVAAAREKYAGVVQDLRSSFTLGTLSESLAISPCHSVGTIGGATTSLQSSCQVSPIKEESRPSFIAFLTRAGQEFQTARQGKGDFTLSVGSGELPRDLWSSAAQPAASFRARPVDYLKLAREIWEAVRQSAPGVSVRLRLPGLDSAALAYLRYEETAGSTLQLVYAGGEGDLVASRAEVEAALKTLFGKSLTTKGLDEPTAATLTSTECSFASWPQDQGYAFRKRLCEMVKSGLWVRRALEAIPAVLGAEPAVPLIVDLHLYGGDYREQLALAGEESFVRRSLQSYPDVVYVAGEQGSPLTPLANKDLADPEGALREAARDWPRSALTLLAAGLRQVPSRPPLSEAVIWPTLDLYGMKGSTGQDRRPAYFAGELLVPLLGGATDGATLLRRSTDGLELFELRPADASRSPTFILWVTSGKSARLELWLDTSSGIWLTESPTEAGPATPRAACGGTRHCGITVSGTPTYLTGARKLEIARSASGKCVDPR